MSGLSTKARAVGVATGVTILGVLIGVVLVVPAVLFGVGTTTVTAAAVLLVLSELGFVAAALAFAWLSGRGRQFLDPGGLDRRAVAYGVGGAVGLLAARAVAVWLVVTFDVPVAGRASGDFDAAALADVVLLLVPISVLVIGPAEELLFRGVVQRYFYESFSRSGAVLAASALFALVHVPNYVAVTLDPTAIVVAVVLVFGISLGLGWLYARTDSLVAAALAHGLYDAAIFAGLYLELVGQRIV